MYNIFRDLLNKGFQSMYKKLKIQSVIAMTTRRFVHRRFCQRRRRLPLGGTQRDLRWRWRWRPHLALPARFCPRCSLLAAQVRRRTLCDPKLPRGLGMAATRRSKPVSRSSSRRAPSQVSTPKPKFYAMLAAKLVSCLKLIQISFRKRYLIKIKNIFSLSQKHTDTYL